MDNRRQMFLVEAYDKEESVRYAWHLKYSKAFAKQAVAKKKQKCDSSKMKVKSTISKRIQNLKNEMKQSSPEPQFIEESTDEASQPVLPQDMRPVTPGTRSLLYNGISAHEEGRYAYLNKRNTKSPEEKYVFPMTSSSLYGWKIMDFSATRSSEYARTCVVRDTFYRPSGIII